MSDNLSNFKTLPNMAKQMGLSSFLFISYFCNFSASSITFLLYLKISRSIHQIVRTGKQGKVCSIRKDSAAVTRRQSRISPKSHSGMNKIK